MKPMMKFSIRLSEFTAQSSVGARRSEEREQDSDEEEVVHTFPIVDQFVFTT